MIRTASVDDARALAALNRNVHELHLAARPDNFRPSADDEVTSWLEERLRAPGARAWLAEVDGAPIGYAVAFAHSRPESPYCHARRWYEIDQIGVHPAHRQRGVGRELVECVIAAARAEGIHEIELSSWAFNEAAQAAFRRYGFSPRVIRFELRLD